MPKIKLPKALLANEHLLIRKRAKRSIFAIAKLNNRSIADLVEEMVNNSISSMFNEDHQFFRDYYIGEPRTDIPTTK